MTTKGNTEPEARMTQPKEQNLVDEMMKDYSCIFYPMCYRARELLYCPKKVRKQDCEDYRPHPAPEPEHGRWRDKDNPQTMGFPQHHTECYIDGYNDGARKAREDVLKPLIEWLSEKRRNYGAVGDRTANDDPEDCDPYDTVLRKVKSLRSEQEQPR